MPDLDYLNFDLSFEHTDEGYLVRVLNSPAGQASERFVFPFSELELENFLLRMGHRRASTRRIDSPEMEACKQFGGKLFDALFNDEMRGCLRSSLDDARRQDKGLRLRLRFSEAPELADIPWEFLYNVGVNRFLVLSQQTPLVRYLDLPHPADALPIHMPLRILVMIADPSDLARLDVEREWQRLQASLADLIGRGLVKLMRLEQASLLALQRSLRRETYHIFHFIGHGDFDARTDQGYLVLETDEGRGQLVSGQDLGFMLHDHGSLRLAVLNACEGGRTSMTDPFAGVAQSLMQQGLPAVVAMQFEITDSAAAVFAHEFYLALADGYPVDAALAEARRAIFAVNMGTEWGVPVLFMRSADGYLFDVESLPVKGKVKSIVASDEIEEVAASSTVPLPKTRQLKPQIEPRGQEIQRALEEVEPAWHVGTGLFLLVTFVSFIGFVLVLVIPLGHIADENFLVSAAGVLAALIGGVLRYLYRLGKKAQLRDEQKNNRLGS